MGANIVYVFYLFMLHVSVSVFFLLLIVGATSTSDHCTEIAIASQRHGFAIGSTEVFFINCVGTLLLSAELQPQPWMKRYQQLRAHFCSFYFEIVVTELL